MVQYMDTGIRVKLHAESPECCPIASASSVNGETVSMISWSKANGDESVVEEFTVSGGDFPSHREVLDTVFEGDKQSRYQFARSDEGCVCSYIEQAGFPIESLVVEHDGLSISFYVSSLDELGELVTGLRESFDGIRLLSLHRTDDLDETVPVWIDRSKLTPRQEEVLRTALEMGYFDYPKRANAGEVAEELGIGLSTFSEHLAAAQSKLLEDVFSH